MNSKRVLFLTFFFILFFGYLVINLFKIQVINNKMYVDIAGSTQNKLFELGAERGIIRDRNSEVLSYTKVHVSYFVDTRMVDKQKIDTIAGKFASIYHKEKKEYIQVMEEYRGNVCIERKSPKEQAVQLKDFEMDALVEVGDYTRVYSYGSLASHVLGFVNLKMEGIEGIEKKYDEYLKGKDGYLHIENDVKGRTVSINENSSRKAIPGENLILTINKTYQKILEEELSKGLKEYEGKSAVGIIMDPNSGEILALANLPTFDPGNYNLFTDEERRNRAITDTYEPGSTMKAVSMAIILDKGLINEFEKVNTENGVYVVRGVKITDDHKFDWLNAREILEQSSNIGMAKLIDKVDTKTFYKYLRDFGFGNSTSIDLIGEARGYLKKPDEFSSISKLFMSFGYEISVTPLQIITAFCALVNGGFLYQPFLVKKITNNGDEIVKEFEPIKIRRVINQQTSDLIKSFMVGVVERGTGQSARLENVLVGGKTGTSQQLVNNNYSKQDYNSSFIGFFPVDKPQIVCLILVDSPDRAKYGGKVAAPIFKQIAKRLVEVDINIVPNKNRIKRNNIVIDGLFADINPDSKETNYFNTPNLKSDTNRNNYVNPTLYNRSTMPNLRGKSLREANAILTELGLKIKKSGSGYVAYQSIEPGTKILGGAICIIECQPGIQAGTN